MKDVQSQPDDRGVDIQKVGVKQLFLPLNIEEKGGGYQAVTASIRASVGLPRDFKGTHMSRFLEVLEGWSKRAISTRQVSAILQDLSRGLGAGSAQLELRFRYFVKKKAPVSGKESLMGYTCFFAGEMNGAEYDFIQGAEVPVLSLCPCSREISAYGAHNQRTMIRARLRPRHMFWLEDLIGALEGQGSSPIYPLLKREDEKYVTEHSYMNPKFVEDILRDCVLFLRRDPRAGWFEVECESLESIHDHSAFAHHLEGEETSGRKT